VQARSCEKFDDSCGKPKLKVWVLRNAKRSDGHLAQLVGLEGFKAKTKSSILAKRKVRFIAKRIVRAVQNKKCLGGRLAQLVRSWAFLWKVPGSNPVIVFLCLESRDRLFLFLKFVSDVFDQSFDASNSFGFKAKI
jgi:hypothetical protein